MQFPVDTTVDTAIDTAILPQLSTPMTNSAALGKFVWYELVTPDIKKSSDFYGKVIGWAFQDRSAEAQMPYSVFSAAGKQLGGIMTLTADMPANVPPHWMPYIYAPDIDAKTNEAQKLGATVIVPPKAVPNLGKFSILKDPQGAVFALWQALEEMNMDETYVGPAVGEFSWHELMTTDYSPAFNFYSTLFGWQAGTPHEMTGLGTYQLFTRNGVPIGGMFNIMPGMDAPPNWTLYIRVQNLNETIKAVQANGGKLIHGPMEVPGGDMIANCIDSTGAVFALHQLKHQ